MQVSAILKTCETLENMLSLAILVVGESFENDKLDT